MKPATIVLPLLACALALTGCDRSSPAPSEKLGKAAEKIVGIATPGAGPTEEAQLGPFAPRDECAELPDASHFLAALRAAVALRDAELLLALTAQDVKLGFGGADGKANLRRALEVPDIWDELDKVLELGCARDAAGSIAMPWYFTQKTKGDPANTMIVTGRDVPLREAASADAPVLARLNWEAVEPLGEPATGPSPASPTPAAKASPQAAGAWQHVRFDHPTGALEGYIARRNLRSPLDHRLLASSRNGRWRIVAFLAGD